MSNLIMCYGCPPTKFVLADTRMIFDLFEALQRRFDRKTLAVEFPQMFADL